MRRPWHADLGAGVPLPRHGLGDQHDQCLRGCITGALRVIIKAVRGGGGQPLALVPAAPSTKSAMNSAYDFSQVDVTLVDPQANTLRLIKDVLTRLRISKIQGFTSKSGVAETLLGGTSDLILLDADQPESESFSLIRQVRNDPTSRNPFVCIIVTTWNPTAGVVSKAVNSGADGLLVKPASPRNIYDRVQACVEGRKKFVVTSDYVGPDRRKSARPGIEIPLLDVPNTLRMKAIGHWNAAAGLEAVSAGLIGLREQKARRNSFQVPFLIEFSVAGMRREPPDPMSAEHLGRVPSVVTDLEHRFNPGELDSKVETACKAILALVDRIRKSEGGSGLDADLVQLQKLSYTLLRGFHPNRSVDELRREVNAAVTMYRKRLEEAAARAAEQARAQEQAEADDSAAAAPQQAATAAEAKA